MDFLELYQKNFPQLTEEEARKLHTQFREYGVHSKWIFSSHLTADTLIAQGDILSGLYASQFDVGDNDNQPSVLGPTEGIVITNTCDNELDRDTNAVFVPLFNAEKYFSSIDDANMRRDIEANVVTSILYMPAHNDLPASIADFSVCTTVTKTWLKKKKDAGQLQKRASLTNNGYYFLLAKLTLHLMRPETTELTREKIS